MRGYFQAMIIIGQIGRDVSPTGVGQSYQKGAGQSKSEKADTWAVVLGTALTF